MVFMHTCRRFTRAKNCYNIGPYLKLNKNILKSGGEAGETELSNSFSGFGAAEVSELAEEALEQVMSKN